MTDVNKETDPMPLSVLTVDARGIPFDDAKGEVVNGHSVLAANILQLTTSMIEENIQGSQNN